MKKVGKTTRQFRYDINQIPDDYIVEVRNIFNGLDLIDCLMNYGWRFVTLHRNRDQDHPQEKEVQKDKMVVRGGLTTAEKRREVKGKGEKERYTHLNAKFQRIVRRDKKAFLSDKCKEIEESNRMEKTRDLLEKIRIPR